MSTLTVPQAFTPYAPYSAQLAYQAGRALYPSLPPAQSVYKYATSGKKKRKRMPMYGPQNKGFIKRTGYKSVGGKTLKKKVSALTKMVNASNATHTYRTNFTGDLFSGESNCTYTSIRYNSSTLIETALAGLRYYDPANPDTLVSAGGGDGTYSRRFGVHELYGKLHLRNNYTVPAKCTIYLLKPKVDTSIDPVTAFTQGMTDQNNPDTTSELIYMTDSDQFNELWSIVKSKSVTIKAGGEFTMSHSEKPFEYDPAFFDSHQLAYQNVSRSKRWVVRMHGVLSHDTAQPLEQGLSNCGMDYSSFTKFVFKYDAGCSLNDFTIDDKNDTFTGVPQVTVLANENKSFSLT